MADDADRAGETDLSGVGLAGTVAGIRDRLAADGRDDCADCGAPIPAGRRDAYRAATRCVECQAEQEGKPSCRIG